MSKLAQREAERAAALEKLRILFPPGSTLYLVSRKRTDAARQWSILAATPHRPATPGVFEAATVENVSALVVAAGIFGAARSRDYFAVTVRGTSWTSDAPNIAYTLGQALHGASSALRFQVL